MYFMHINIFTMSLLHKLYSLSRSCSISYFLPLSPSVVQCHSLRFHIYSYQEFDMRQDFTDGELKRESKREWPSRNKREMWRVKYTKHGQFSIKPKLKLIHHYVRCTRNMAFVWKIWKFSLLKTEINCY